VKLRVTYCAYCCSVSVVLYKYWDTTWKVFVIIRLTSMIVTQWLPYRQDGTRAPSAPVPSRVDGIRADGARLPSWW